MPVWLSRTLLFGLGIVFVLLPFHAFISTWGGTAIGPLWLWKSWKEMLLVLLFVATFGWLVYAGRLREVFSRPYTIVLACYVALTLVMTYVFLTRNGAEAAAVGLAMNLRYLLIAIIAYAVFRYTDNLKPWLERAGRFVVIAGLIVSAIGVVQSLILPADFLERFGYSETTIAPATLIDDNPDLLRAFSTLRGPNDFGAFLILPIILTLAYARQFPLWFSIISMFFMSWALVLSSSRSAWIGALVALGVYGALEIGKRLSRRTLIYGALGIFVAGFIGLYAAVTVPVVRMAVFHSSPGDPSLFEGSTEDHFIATGAGIGRVVDNPLGCGAGCAGPASYYGESPRISENYFVQIAEEVGVLGLVLFILLVTFIGRELLTTKHTRPLSRALFAALIGYAAVGLFLHVWADDPLTMTWWLLAGAVIGYNESQQWKKSKASSRSKTSSSS